MQSLHFNQDASTAYISMLLRMSVVMVNLIQKSNSRMHAEQIYPDSGEDLWNQLVPIPLKQQCTVILKDPSVKSSAVIWSEFRKSQMNHSKCRNPRVSPENNRSGECSTTCSSHNYNIKLQYTLKYFCRNIFKDVRRKISVNWTALIIYVAFTF